MFAVSRCDRILGDAEQKRVVEICQELEIAIPLEAQNGAVTVSVDVNASRHAINPAIYGGRTRRPFSGFDQQYGSQTETSGQWVYRVQGYNAAGTSGYSNSVTIRVR
jgi:hypothetical protein